MDLSMNNRAHSAGLEYLLRPSIIAQQIKKKMRAEKCAFLSYISHCEGERPNGSLQRDPDISDAVNWCLNRGSCSCIEEYSDETFEGNVESIVYTFHHHIASARGKEVVFKRQQHWRPHDGHYLLSTDRFALIEAVDRVEALLRPYINHAERNNFECFIKHYSPNATLTDVSRRTVFSGLKEIKAFFSSCTCQSGRFEFRDILQPFSGSPQLIRYQFVREYTNNGLQTMQSQNVVQYWRRVDGVYSIESEIIDSGLF
ncbi:unnamed protein product, partial [Mesorhabditis spiculigera]